MTSTSLSPEQRTATQVSSVGVAGKHAQGAIQEVNGNILLRRLSRLFPQDGGSTAPTGEPWGFRLWLTLAAIVVVAACLQSYGINKWPMADDEVPSLVEMGL